MRSVSPLGACRVYRDRMRGHWLPKCLALALTLSCDRHRKEESTPVATTSASATVPATVSATTGFVVGQSVAAQWGSSWWIGTITGKNGTKWDVLYGDGDKGTLTDQEMIALDTARTFRAGDRVLARWMLNKMYPGTITTAKHPMYTVAWDDGSAPTDVASSMIAPRPASMTAPSSSPPTCLSGCMSEQVGCRADATSLCMENFPQAATTCKAKCGLR